MSFEEIAARKRSAIRGSRVGYRSRHATFLKVLATSVPGRRFVLQVDIAFIAVNYNTLAWVRRLTSFFDSLDVPFTFTFTVVDNHSGDGSQEFLQIHRGVTYLQTGGNIGYGRAINRGVATTASKYVCVTNTDVILNREALIELWRFLEGRPDVGVCAPLITYEDGRYQGMVFLPSLVSHYANWFAKMLAGYSKLKIKKATEPLRVDGVMGAFFLIRRFVIPTPTLFDEDFFFFHEDTALAHTLKNRGVPCFIIPGATIIHVGGESRSASSISFFYESKYLYLRKFYGPLHAKAVYFMDRTRILRQWLLYSLFSLLTASERIKSKQRYYKVAWGTARLR
jgi:N-acetylglucosaminyl-diphospho-decaprenol L-rhamnosyltransferase